MQCDKENAQYPLIASFRTNSGKCYIYDAPTNEIVEVKEKVWTLMASIDFWHNPTSMTQIDLNYIEKAKSEGLLSNKRPKLMGIPLDKSAYQAALDSEINQLILNVTEQCNLRCSYCTYSGHYKNQRAHAAVSMESNTAIKATQFFLERNHKADNTFISFYGGEPTLNLSAIKSVVEYCNKNSARTPLFNLTTNGVIKKDEALDFLVKNNFSIHLSLDGPKEIHDRYRRKMNNKGSFKEAYNCLKRLCKINKEFVYKNVRISVVLSPPYDLKTVQHFFDNDEILSNLDLRVSMVSHDSTTFLESEEVNNASKEIIPEGRQYSALRAEYKQSLISGKPHASGFLKALFEDSMLKLHKRNLYEEYSAMIPLNGSCNPGLRRLAVASNGDFYICEKVDATLSIGSVNTGFDFTSIEKYIEAYSSGSQHNCTNCFANRFCSACFATNFSSDGFHQKSKLEACSAIRNGFVENLIDYCEVLEKNPTAFNFFRDYYVA